MGHHTQLGKERNKVVELKEGIKPSAGALRVATINARAGEPHGTIQELISNM
jgi:hypothetical protein